MGDRMTELRLQAYETVVHERGELDELTVLDLIAEIRASWAERDALLRALLEIEWEDSEDWCPSCNARGNTRDDPSGRKHFACWTDEALTKAGLPDQASRDEARATFADVKKG